MEVPVRLLCQATGYFGPKLRLPKKPAIERAPMGFMGGWRPPEVGRDFQVRKENPNYVVHRSLTQRYNEVREERKTAGEWFGNLQLGDYRYWVGCKTMASKWARCRCCGFGGLSVSMRKGHMEQTKCTDILVRAYGLLMKDTLCVVCDKHCDNTRWGVPVHKGCQETFMFSMEHSLNPSCQVQEAVRLVIQTDPHTNRPPLLVL